MRIGLSGTPLCDGEDAGAGEEGWGRAEKERVLTTENKNADTSVGVQVRQANKN